MTESDAATAVDAGKAGKAAHPSSDAGQIGFGFSAFGLDASARAVQRVDAAMPPTFTVPDGWRCRLELGSDRVCDCGCGAPDPACLGLGCASVGCSLPACEACFDADGQGRDCGAPGAWSCERSRRSDGVCDCGCGAFDPDCGPNGGCYQPGCNVPGCQACHGADGAHDCGTPPAFLCAKSVLGDGKCDCGCGNYDSDCLQSSCIDPGCSATGCDVCHDKKGKAITCARASSDFACDAALRGNGKCDCGCGAADPDCGSAEGCVEAGCGAPGCDACHDAFGRELPCPGQWTCKPARFADGRACDCGCGRPDPDCGGNGCAEPECMADACDARHDAQGVAIAPSSWACAASAYGRADGCDCGCGALDPDCIDGCSDPGCRTPSCDHCRQGDGSAFDCGFACDLAHFATSDGCDCGCGAFDPDCKGSGCYEPGCYATGCERCFDSGGQAYACVRGACPAGFAGDSVCDCGCRVDDPDCASVASCVEPGCSASGCGRCYDADGKRLTCGDWSCGLEQQGAGDGCNCGCGAPDPDCGAGEGCSLQGCAAIGCVTCRGYDGAPMSCSP